MREYEFVYILHPDLESEREQEIHSRFQAVLERVGATFLLLDDWGKRKLAYEIAKLQKGHYFLLSFLGDGSFIPELERVGRLDPDVLRFLTVLVDEQVADLEARQAKAAEEREEQAKRREERERQEAERAAQAAARPAPPDPPERDESPDSADAQTQPRVEPA